MLKSLRVPEKLFQLATWIVSALFAGFLLGLGSQVIGELPGVKQYVTLDQFLDSAQVKRLDASRDSLRRASEDDGAELQRVQLRLTTASNAYRSRRESYQNWLATRVVTTDPRQDPQVLARTRELDTLKAAERAAQLDVERVQAAQLSVSQALERQQRQREDLAQAASGRYERARFRQELGIFGIRLALTLPLLLVAGWLILRKRKSQYWPLARGFVLFAVFTFFVELVPYLPSYGGYVRNAVGALATAFAGVYVIRAMRRYLARREAEERQTESERRRRLGYEDAIKKIAAGVCPGCERPVAAGSDGKPVNFCVHCGMTLFDTCGACSTRKNAFYQFCPVCGVPAGKEPATAGA